MHMRNQNLFYRLPNGKASMLEVLRRIVLFFAASILLSACATTPPRQGPYYPRPNQGPTGGGVRPIIPDTKTPDTTGPDDKNPDGKSPDKKRPRNTSGLTPAFMDPDNIKRVAIILPLSAKSSRLRAEANSMLKAAELALFASGEDDMLLMALDSAGTVSGARTATQQAIKQSASVILGPILAKSVAASGLIARKSGTPVIAFSTDTSVAGKGVYLLSFPPEAEVKRVTEFVARSGARKFAFLGPDSIYGQRVLSAYKTQIDRVDGIINGVETYTGKDIRVMQEPARKLAKLYTDTKLANEAAGRPASDAAFHAVLLPEGGTPLRSIAPLLSYFEDDINSSNVQFMGTGLWNRKEVVREPALSGGIFAGPDVKGKKVFESNFEISYGEEPSRLASLAYDAVNIAAFVAGDTKTVQYKKLTDKAGFFGVDGLVSFNPNGTPERGLAVYQVKNGRFVIIDAAPLTSGGAF